MELIAHRGESHDAPENTLAAFRLAWERGIRTVELDLRLTRDGHLVICHDADTKRTTGTPGLIAEQTLAELRGLDAGRWKGEQWAGERLPTMDEVLDILPAHGRLWIEIKAGPATVPPLVDLLQTRGVGPERFAVISFHDEDLCEAKRLMPDAAVYLISSFKKGSSRGEWHPSVHELVDRAKAVNARGINTFWIGPVTPKNVRLVHEDGLEFGVWTVDQALYARRLLKAGVDTITSNRAAALRDELGLSSAW